MTKKKINPNTRTVDRKIKDRRKGPRTIHIIDKDTTPRELELAKNDLLDFFDPYKHHEGW